MGVLEISMPFLKGVDDEEATGEVADVYQAWKTANPGRDRMPEILKCFSLRPDFLKSAIDFSYPLHFTDGFLKRRVKEMIATYVSGLNKCKY
jgi:hypothetical protein